MFFDTSSIGAADVDMADSQADKFSSKRPNRKREFLASPFGNEISIGTMNIPIHVKIGRTTFPPNLPPQSIQQHTTMSTLSPHKRARLAQAGSAVSSPFALPSSSTAARPTPPAPQALSSLAAFSTMSPAESFSPFYQAANTQGTGIGLGTAFGTPYAGGGSAATSPISTALFHGSKVLSNIQPSGALPSSSAAKELTSITSVPQQDSPQHLRLALQHLQDTLLVALEAEAKSYFDAV